MLMFLFCQKCWVKGRLHNIQKLKLLRASGKVLRAQVRDAGFDVAIKICKNMNTVCLSSQSSIFNPQSPRKLMLQRVQAELEKEIEVLKQCKHPNIVAYYGTKIQSDSQEIWIIMVLLLSQCGLTIQDYCGVGSVKDVMKTADECLTESQIAYVLQQTLKGLCHLHQRGILHLDIKAANSKANHNPLLTSQFC